MAVFEYTGLVARTGKQVKGVRDADNPKALRAVLKREGVLLTGAHEEKHTATKQGRKLNISALFNRVNVGDIAMMTRQLATLVRAGIPLVEAVTALTDQVEKLELKRVLTQVRDRLNEGTALARALEAHPKVFPPLYVNMVAAGEASGTLEGVLERLSDFMEGQARLRGKVGAALAYPAVMLLIGTVLVSIMMVVVVPKVTGIFESMDRALPWYTQLLMTTSKALGSTEMLGFLLSFVAMTLIRRALAPSLPTDSPETRAARNVFAAIAGIVFIIVGVSVDSLFSYFIGCVLGIIAGFLLARLLTYIATPRGQIWKDTIMLRLPVFGQLFRMLAVSRFSRTLATLLQSGVPLLKAMEIVKNVIGNARLAEVVGEATGSIREGESIAGPLKRSGDFPPIVIHMIAVGEKSGQLESMLENVARAYDTQVDTRVQALTSLLEPLMIVVMGSAVGFIAFAILMPLIQMNDFVQ